MTAQDKIYHIYAKDRCIFHSLKEEEFETTWNALKKLVGIIRSDYNEEDLSFVELPVNKEITQNASY